MVGACLDPSHAPVNTDRLLRSASVDSSPIRPTLSQKLNGFAGWVERDILGRVAGVRLNEVDRLRQTIEGYAEKDSRIAYAKRARLSVNSSNEPTVYSAIRLSELAGRRPSVTCITESVDNSRTRTRVQFGNGRKLDVNELVKRYGSSRLKSQIVAGGGVEEVVSLVETVGNDNSLTFVLRTKNSSTLKRLTLQYKESHQASTPRPVDNKREVQTTKPTKERTWWKRTKGIGKAALRSGLGMVRNVGRRAEEALIRVTRRSAQSSLRRLAGASVLASALTPTVFAPNDTRADTTAPLARQSTLLGTDEISSHTVESLFETNSIYPSADIGTTIDLLTDTTADSLRIQQASLAEYALPSSPLSTAPLEHPLALSSDASETNGSLAIHTQFSDSPLPELKTQPAIMPIEAHPDDMRFALNTLSPDSLPLPSEVAASTESLRSLEVPAIEVPKVRAAFEARVSDHAVRNLPSHKQALLKEALTAVHETGHEITINRVTFEPSLYHENRMVLHGERDQEDFRVVYLGASAESEERLIFSPNPDREEVEAAYEDFRRMARDMIQAKESQ